MYDNTSNEQLYVAAKRSFGGNIKRTRQTQSISQEALALKIDADQAYISRIESGHLNPTLESIAEISAALNVPIMDLFK